MQLHYSNQAALGNIIGSTPEVLDYNVREAHERGYFEGAATVGDVVAGYVAYLADMVEGHGITLKRQGPIGPSQPGTALREDPEQ